MNFDGNFRRVGDVNVDLTKAYVEKLSDESWLQDIDDVRLAANGEGCQVIYLVHDDQLRHDQPIQHPALQVFGKIIRPILAVTADYFDSSAEGRRLSETNDAGYFIRAHLLRLAAGSQFSTGSDRAFSEAHSHRVHVPIVSAGPVDFVVTGETLDIPEGEVFEINNRRAYSIDNRSDAACVHLVLDYVLKGEMCCCGAKSHPGEGCSLDLCYATDHSPDRCQCFKSA